MKTNGIVRKLDRLGRIVIPREYRKMHKIHESDPLGIFALDNGDIVIRKVDVSAELKSAGEPIADELYRSLGLTVMLSDTERFLAGAGAGTLKSRLLEAGDLSERAKVMIESRKCFSGKASEPDIAEAQFVSLCTVFGENVFGSLMLLSDHPIEKADEKMLRLAAKILGNFMQRF